MNCLNPPIDRVLDSESIVDNRSDFGRRTAVREWLENHLVLRIKATLVDNGVSGSMAAKGSGSF